ncbi:MAG: hypothetical protein AAFR81_14260 [Chloroflexota bacterium]
MRHILTVFIIAHIPDFHHFIDNIHTGLQFNGCLFRIGGTGFPMSNFTLILVFDCQIFFSAHVTV